jgi:hypothetical protein
VLEYVEGEEFATIVTAYLPDDMKWHRFDIYSLAAHDLSRHAIHLGPTMTALPSLIRPAADARMSVTRIPFGTLTRFQSMDPPT